MPNEFQRVMDSTIENHFFTNLNLDDILISSKRNFTELEAIVENVLTESTKIISQSNGPNAMSLKIKLNG